MTRILGYRNSFAPEIQGAIVAAERGCSISVRMSLAPMVQIFMAVWLGAAAVIGLVFFCGALVSAMPLPEAIAPFGLLLFGLLLMLGGFWLEANNCQRILEELFEVARSESGARS